MQRATTLFQLGLALTEADRPAEAAAALHESCALFDPERLPVEYAKAQNALGAALRTSGADGAARSFEEAARRFADVGLQLEEGAARFNLGLVLRASGDFERAREEFTTAQRLLSGASPAYTAAAARELGATVLELGEIARAVELLTDAAERAERAGDRAGAGAARNTRGLAELASGDMDRAVADFRAAAHAHPRGLRPAEHAMAKANLALAYERRGLSAHARLAVRQALASPVVPEPVRQQAQASLERLGGARAGDVVVVLASAESAERTGIVRDEVVRWTAEPADVRCAEARVWIEAQAALPEPAAIDMAELLLAVMLEQPPAEMDALIRSLVSGTNEVSPALRASFNSTTPQAMARFHVPQLMRLRDTFARVAAELGMEGWS